jgi:hypothetical protein
LADFSLVGRSGGDGIQAQAELVAEDCVHWVVG